MERRRVNDHELIHRYKMNYGIPLDAPITEDMILHHWELEKELTMQLRESTPDNRWEVFERCYSTLYAKLDWLNLLSGTSEDRRAKNIRARQDWIPLIGNPPETICEIGCGKGDFIRYLAELGFICTGMEITHERGAKWVTPHANLQWRISDGVHLDRFEPENAYDVVISNSVIEHLHPDDLIDHFRGVQFILRKNGRYIFVTPHTYQGPSDISKIFNCDRPEGMHLREYTWAELKRSLRKAGFNRVSVPIRLPYQIRKVLGSRPKTKMARGYLTYLCILERMIAVLPNQKLRRRAAQLLMAIGFPPRIMIVAEKTCESKVTDT